MIYEKKLPIAHSPIIGLQYLAYPLCILLNYKEAIPWFHSNYIQVIWSKNNQRQLTFFPNSFHDIPIMDSYIITKDLLKSLKLAVNDFIQNCINQGYYFYSTFDEYYVSHRRAYRNYHFYHDFLIYGFNSSKNEYFLLGFDDKLKFVTTHISYNDFKKSFFSYDENTNYIHLLRRRESINYSFKKELILELIDDYLNSRNTADRYKLFYGNVLSDRVFGISIYDCFLEYFTLLMNDKIDFDIRPIHIFYEHKKCMVLRLEYMVANKSMENNEYLYNNFKNLASDFLAMRNLQMKYLLNKDKNNLVKIIKKLKDNKEKEKKLIELFISHIL